MILALAARLGCLALAVADRLKPRDDAAFDAHVADALALAAPEPVLPAEMWDAACTPDRTVRDLLVRAKAALRTCDFGDEDFAEWGRELMFEEES
jgi:hypothetical protein